jgi:LmbE family N-acetylglucosaminyl deacetylase
VIARYGGHLLFPDDTPPGPVPGPAIIDPLHPQRFFEGRCPNFNPQVYVDITDTLEAKLDALRATARRSRKAHRGLSIIGGRAPTGIRAGVPRRFTFRLLTT